MKNQRIFWILIVSISTVIMLNSCSNDKDSTPAKDPVKNPSSTSDSSLSCNLPTCSGSDCCDEDDKDCENICNRKLGLRGDSLDKCYALEKEVVEDLENIFSDIFGNPDVQDLRTIGEDDIELACAAVKEIDVDILGDVIEDYSSNSSDSVKVLGWIAETENAWEIFNQGEDSIELLRDLLKKAGGGTDGDSAILEGLKEDVELEKSRDNAPFLVVADDHDNTDLIAFIHSNIITDKDDEICSKKSNWPDVDDSASSPVTNADETDQEAACILGVYCAIAPPSEEDADKFRESVASFLSEDDVEKLIKNDLDRGGLGLDDDKDYEEWSDRACNTLAEKWANDGLDLGL